MLQLTGQYSLKRLTEEGNGIWLIVGRQFIRLTCTCIPQTATYGGLVFTNEILLNSVGFMTDITQNLFS